MTGYGLAPLDSLELSLENGYPTVVAYRIMIKFDVPEEGAGPTLIKIPNFGMVDRVVPPIDPDWKGLVSDVRPFVLSEQLLVGSKTVKMILNGNPCFEFSTAANVGQTMNIALLLHGDLSHVGVNLRLPPNDPTIDYLMSKHPQ